jgi:hypothetical protein
VQKIASQVLTREKRPGYDVGPFSKRTIGEKGCVMVVKRRREVWRVLMASSVLAVLLSRAVSANTVAVTNSDLATELILFVNPPQLFHGVGFVSSPTSNGTDIDAMVFDLSFIPSGTPITSANFTMSVGGTSPAHGLPFMDVFDYVGTSRLVSLGDFSLPTNLVGNFPGLPVSAPPGSDFVHTFDVSGFVQSLVNNGTPYAGFRFQDDGGGIEDIPGSTVPSLTITSPVFLTVPEPHSVIMLAVGIAGVLLAVIAARPLGITTLCAVGRTRR